MNILHVTNYFKPSWEAGGPAKVAYDLSTTLVKRGHEVTIYTTDGFKYRQNVVKNKPVDVDGIRTYYFRNLSSYLSKNLVLPIPYFLPMIAHRQLKDFDIIHIHEYRTVSAIFIRYFAKKYNVPYVLQAHGTSPKIVKRIKLKTLFDDLFGKKIIRDATTLFALNETEVKQYLALGANTNQIEIIPNGIDLNEYGYLPSKGEFRNKYLIKSDKIVLYVGRLHKSKGIDLLIKSFVELSKQLDDVKLVIVGPNDGYMDYFEQLIDDLKIKDKVIFTGFVSISDKMAAYVDSDVFVTPWFSGFPITFLESCVCSTPIVTTTKGDKLDWIDGNVGFVVNYDINDLKDAILCILSDEEIRYKLNKNCKFVIENNFALENVVNKIFDIYTRDIEKS